MKPEEVKRIDAARKHRSECYIKFWCQTCESVIELECILTALSGYFDEEE